jgi:hypothetical protein
LDISNYPPPMQSPKGDISHITLPRQLIFTTAVTCGVLAALAVQAQLSRAGLDVASLLQNVFSAKALQLRTAGPWWGIAGAAFTTSGTIAAILSRFPLPWRGFRLLRWTLGGLIVFALAHVGHAAGAPPGTTTGTQVGASLAALCVAALMAIFGAYFTVRR